MSNTRNGSYEWLGFSLKSILLILAGIVALGLYIGVLLFGENSLVVLNKLQNDKERLMLEKTEIKKSNQELQKEYFELLQLTE
ncbi:MAG: hypothetical protein HF962_06215 [Sulfurovum sp.]|nr:hypothetical protein [Sulfurovum sp.]